MYDITVHLYEQMKEDAREKLKRIGRAWLTRGGIRNIKLRQICEEAGVSPGTFTAHFRTLGNFNEILLREWYEPLRESVEHQSHARGNSLEVLKAELRAAIQFICRNSGVLVQLYMDAAMGEKTVFALFRQTKLTHVAHLRNAIRQAMKDGYLIAGDGDAILFYLVGAIGLPIIVFQLMNDKLPPDIRLVENLKNTADEAATIQRMEWALKGISQL